jgi:hypothetical protein
MEKTKIDFASAVHQISEATAINQSLNNLF